MITVTGPHAPAAPFERGLLERMTLPRVWAMLAETEREVLEVAERGVTAAAATLGLPRVIYANRLRSAQAHARALWADWEPPMPSD